MPEPTGGAIVNLLTREKGQERERFPTIVHSLIDAAKKYPERSAVICDGNSLTYEEVNLAAASLAITLRQRGIKSGDRIAVIAPASLQLPQIIFGVMGAEAQVTMMNPNFTQRELEPLFRISEPRAVLCHPKLRKTLLRLSKKLGFEVISISDELWCNSNDWVIDRLPNGANMAVLLFTGGTTGVSKGVPHTHEQVIASLLAIEDRWPTSLDCEVFLNIPPLFHIVGLYHGCFQPVFGRSTSVLISRFEPEEVFNLINKYRVSIFIAGVPAAYIAMLNHPAFDKVNYKSIRFACGGGAPLAKETLHEWERRTGVPALEGYGMTEGAPTCNNPFSGERRVLSIGKPVYGIELEIVDVATGTIEMNDGEHGEIRVRGSHIAGGYFNNVEATSSAFRENWLYTGDIAYRDRDGFIYIVDRAKDMAIVSGFNVFPREIDEILMAHPHIKEAASIAVPDAEKGEVIKAFVCLNDGSNLTEDQIKDYCREDLVGYKIPKQIIFREGLPKTPVGKIDKNQLRK